MTNATGVTTPADAKTGPAALPWFGVLTGLALVGFFGWLTYEMFAERTMWAEPQWTRSMTIYGAIEAFALSAAGALMGVQIQSGRVKAAEAQVAAKAQDAAQARVQHLEASNQLAVSQAILQQAREHLDNVDAPAQGDDLKALRSLLAAAP